MPWEIVVLLWTSCVAPRRKQWCLGRNFSQDSCSTNTYEGKLPSNKKANNISRALKRVNRYFSSMIHVEIIALRFDSSQAPRDRSLSGASKFSSVTKLRRDTADFISSLHVLKHYILN
jgi:hypothetical protein